MLFIYAGLLTAGTVAGIFLAACVVQEIRELIKEEEREHGRKRKTACTLL